MRRDTAGLTRQGSLWLSAAGGDDLRLPAGPVIHDLLAGNGKRIVWVDIVEVSEAQHDVVKRLIGEPGLETLKEQRQPLVGCAVGALLDRHQVEVVAQLTAIVDDLEFHRHEVADLRDLKSVELLGWLEQSLWVHLVRVQELHPGG